MSGRLLVLGDIHGAHRALVQVLERGQVDRERDRVIFLGDACDGWPESRQVIDELLTLKKLVYIRGNHDDWALQWMTCGWRGREWRTQGGMSTMASYDHNVANVPASHHELLRKAEHWHQEEGRIFVHGGWPLQDRHPMSCGPQTLMWDRTLWREAYRRWCYNPEARLTDFDEIYVGHTTTEEFSLEPVQACEVWNMDQGCGWRGKLSLMDVESKEVWQSDITKDLYPEHGGRLG